MTISEITKIQAQTIEVNEPFERDAILSGLLNSGYLTKCAKESGVWVIRYWMPDDERTSIGIEVSL